MDDVYFRPDAGRGVRVAMRDQEFEDVDVPGVATAFVSGARVDEERHGIQAVTYDPEPERRHAAVLALLDARFVGQGQPHDVQRRETHPGTNLDDPCSDEAALVLFLDKGVAEHTAVPVCGTEILEAHRADRFTDAVPAFEDTVGFAVRRSYRGKCGAVYRPFLRCLQPAELH